MFTESYCNTPGVSVNTCSSYVLKHFLWFILGITIHTGPKVINSTISTPKVTELPFCVKLFKTLLFADPFTEWVHVWYDETLRSTTPLLAYLKVKVLQT